MRLGALLCVFGMAIVGSAVSLSQLIVDYPHLTGQAVRYAVAAAILGVLVRGPRVVPTARELGILAALAATGLAAFNALILIALPHADAAVVGTVIGAAPLGIALLAPLMRGARPAGRIVIAAAVVVGGTALVQGTGRADLIGLLASLGALAGEILFSLLAAAVLPRLGAVRVAGYSCALAVPLLLVAAIPAGEIARLRMPTGTEAATLAYLAIGMTVVAFVAWFTGLQRLGVERAGMIVGVMPIATLVTAAIQAGRLPETGQVLGVLVVAAGLGVGLTVPIRASAASAGLTGQASAARTASANSRAARRSAASASSPRARAAATSANNAAPSSPSFSTVEG